MLRDTLKNKDLRTFGIVLRRTNYGEADRILNIITPEGKVPAIARGVRKEKSKMAGNVELFSLIELNIHFGKNEMGVLTGAKMKKHFGNIVKDLRKMELASMILKKINNVSENFDNPEYFKIVKESLEGLDSAMDLRLIETWFLLNLQKANGGEVNLYFDNKGDKLESTKRYDWRGEEEVFYLNEDGEFGANEIKMLRLILASDLGVLSRVKSGEETISKVLEFARFGGR